MAINKTRQHNTQSQCPNCKSLITIEDPFGVWLRANPGLDSYEHGITITDVDYTVHKYKTYRDSKRQSREIQCLFEIEVKTFNAEPTPSQRDTLHLKNQLLRNEALTPTKDAHNKYQVGIELRKVRSMMLKRDIRIWVRGVHLLQFSGAGPFDSEEIKWHGRPITLDQLTKIINCDLDPDDPSKKWDMRSHHNTIMAS